MADIFTKAKRSHVMSLIRSRGNKDTEVVLAKLFQRHGVTGWRKHLQLKITNSKLKKQKGKAQQGKLQLKTKNSKFKTIKVRPDFVFPKHKLAVFVDGCFWHGCPIHGTQPKGNRAFWKKKFATNIARDRLVSRTLRRANWRVVRIWEHTLRRALKTLSGEAKLVRKLGVGS